MKKSTTLFMIAVLLLSMLTGCDSPSSDTAVTVQKVSRIAAQGSVGLVNRYAGLVVSGETASVKRQDKKIREVFVKEGDWVEAEEVLFCYDMEAMELELSKMLLELDGLDSTIANAEEEIPKLEAERDKANADKQLSYSLQIQTLRADIREATYKKGLKEKEIANLQEALQDTNVRSPIAGRVMSVQDPDNPNAGAGEDGSNAFITVMDMTTYQVKGTINEINVGTLFEGMSVIVRSRLDENVTWHGTLERIDWEKQVTGQSSGYYMGPSDEMTTSTKYPFYVTLDNVTGLILGQHVYIEPDYGQQETREGLWLPEYYIVTPRENPTVWASNRNDRLEKRTVSLGEYDENTGEYRVLSGLTADDYIAFPDETLEPGMKTVLYTEAQSYVASAGNAFYGAYYASSGNASAGDAVEPPDESLYATEEDFAALAKSEEGGD